MEQELHTLFGPPGTGKTTALMDLILKDLETTEPDDIAFVSYTRQGAYEGANRARERFNLKLSDMPFFKTIHSLCFRDLGMRKYDMFQQKHYKTFSEKTGINFLGYYTQDFTSPNDEYLHALSMERHNPELAEKMSRHLDEKKYNFIKTQYAAMKKQLGIKDFNDLLEDYLAYCKPFKVSVAYIDEAQDLTPLQWRVVMHMFKLAKKITIAGDDDQAVYEWAGADTRKFLSFSKSSTVLHKSYRLPAKVCHFANRITRDIAIRKRKEFIDNGSEGVVEKANSLTAMDLKGGELILSRTNFRLKQLSEELESQGIYYSRKGMASIEPIVLNGIRAYIGFGLTGDDSEVKKFGNLFRAISSEIPWTKAIDRPPGRIAYYERIIETGAVEKPPVLLETFHSSKGSENNHVIVSPDISVRVQSEFNKSRDAELRCLYVGMTRTRDKLTILTPKWTQSYPAHYFSM